jgi:SAM-dependent methyltransferase
VGVRKEWGYVQLLGAWIIGGYSYDVLWRGKQAERAARGYCDRVGKPLLNVGSGTSKSSVATILLGPSRGGDVNMDIAAQRACPPPMGLSSFVGPPACKGDAHDLSQYPDGYFGAVLASHVLEHLDDPDSALREWRRVSDRQYVVTPKWWWAHAWWGFDPSDPLRPSHQWIFAGASKMSLWGRK